MYNRCNGYFDMKNELEHYEQQGIVISVEGKKVIPRHAAQLCCFDNKNDYMPDYIIDDDGKVVEIGFNRVRSY